MLSIILWDPIISVKWIDPNLISLLVMIMPNNYKVFFDPDRTIISRNSGSMVIWQAYKNGVMSSGNLIDADFQSYLYKFKLRDTNLIILKMGTLLKGLLHEVIDELSKKVVDKYLIKVICPEIIKALICLTLSLTH
jgi:hypothetical protein